MNFFFLVLLLSARLMSSKSGQSKLMVVSTIQNLFHLGRTHWATRSSTDSFPCTAHSFTCSALRTSVVNQQVPPELGGERGGSSGGGLFLRLASGGGPGSGRSENDECPERRFATPQGFSQS